MVKDFGAWSFIAQGTSSSTRGQWRNLFGLQVKWHLLLTV